MTHGTQLQDRQQKRGDRKMKKNICLAAGLFLLVFVWANPGFAADKIGFVNMQEVIQTSTAGKKAAEEFKGILAKKQDSIKAAENELKKMKDELDKQASVMTAAARSEKETTYQRKLRDYQLLVDDTNKELQRRDQEYSQKLIPEILKAVRAIGEREKYTLIMDYSTMPLPYHDKAADVTKKVIEEYNKQQNAKK
jgi:outer membrane protein